MGHFLPIYAIFPPLQGIDLSYPFMYVALSFQAFTALGWFPANSNT